MGITDKYIFKFVNSSVGAANYQIVDLDTNPVHAGITPPPAQVIAQGIAYFVSLGGGLAVNSQLVEVQYRAAGSAGAVAQPFPTAEYASLVLDAAAGGITLPALALGYGSALGANALCPLGTSISVSERTAHVGPTGRGRHFLPFISVNTVDASGHVLAAVRSAMETAYETFLLGQGFSVLSIIPTVWPVVTNSVGAHAYDIVTIKAQPIFSNLESRRR